jgi:hypothetical protein
MKKYVLTGVAVVWLSLAGSVGAGVYAANELSKDSSDNTCDAPCTVVFPENMEEDEFKIDYTSEKKLQVWRSK